VLIHLVLFSLLDVLLLLLAVIITVSIVVVFGAPWDGRHSRCPACGAEALTVLEAGHQPGRLTMYRCAKCGVGFRLQLDGTLAAMPSN
jgi:transposase-like protein